MAHDRAPVCAGFGCAAVSDAALGECMVFVACWPRSLWRMPAAVYRRGEQRAFWVGFAACGWVYFVLRSRPGFKREAGFQFVTTTVLDLMAPHIVQKDYLLRSYGCGLQSPVHSGSTNSAGRSGTYRNFRRISRGTRGLCDAGQPRPLSSDRPRVLLHADRVLRWRDRPLSCGDLSAAGRHGAIRWQLFGPRRFQFSVRSLLIMTAVLALSLARWHGSRGNARRCSCTGDAPGARGSDPLGAPGRAPPRRSYGAKGAGAGTTSDEVRLWQSDTTKVPRCLPRS